MRMTLGFLATRTLGAGLGMLLLSGCEAMRADFARLTSPTPAAATTARKPSPPPAARPVKPVAVAAATAAASTLAPAPDAPVAEGPPPVLTGLRESELRAMLGPPTSEENRPPGKQLRYRNGKCTLDIQLYPDVETKQYGTLAYKVKSDDDTDEGRRLCLAQLRSRIPAR
jgi:glucose/arabinose dehydrogenase